MKHRNAGSTLEPKICMYSCEGDALTPDNDGVLRIQFRSIHSDYRFNAHVDNSDACSVVAKDVCQASHVQEALRAAMKPVPKPSSFYGIVEFTTRPSSTPSCFYNCGGSACEIGKTDEGQCRRPNADCGTQVNAMVSNEHECHIWAQAYCAQLTNTEAPSNYCWGRGEPLPQRANQSYLWTFVGVVLVAWIFIVLFYLGQWFGRSRRHKT